MDGINEGFIQTMVSKVVFGIVDKVEKVFVDEVIQAGKDDD